MNNYTAHSKQLAISDNFEAISLNYFKQSLQMAAKSKHLSIFDRSQFLVTILGYLASFPS